MENSTATIAIKDPGLLKTIETDAEARHEWIAGRALPVYSPLEKRLNLAAKRSFDIVFSSLCLLVFLSWLIPLIALLIKLDSRGPVFFLQKRRKRNREVFTCIKFRTMVENEEKDTLAACVNDGRITRIGKFLRTHHLDELPQLFNVWWGDMSLIGPRPYMLSDDDRFEDLVKQYPLRYKVKPGITGLAQVLGYVGPVADLENIKERVRHDAFYICHWSAWLDARIFCRTFFKMLGVK